MGLHDVTITFHNVLSFFRCFICVRRTFEAAKQCDAETALPKVQCCTMHSNSPLTKVHLCLKFKIEILSNMVSKCYTIVLIILEQ